MAKSCSTVASSKTQRVFAVVEDVTGVLQRPTAAGYILPAGRATMNQVPTFTNSDELTDSLDVVNQFKDAVKPGEGKISTIVHIPTDGSKMQAAALFEAMMGIVQEPNVASAVIATGGGINAGDTTINISGITGGVFPDRGEVLIGTERIRYLGVTLNTSGVVTALTNCVRGYHSTTAASHAAADSISLKSRVYIQGKCRPTCSVWIQNDHTVMFASGCVVTSVAVPQSKTGGQHCDFTFQFRQLGWAGRSFLGAIPSTGVLSVVTAANVAAGGAYTVGAIVKNTTKNDDNGGAGYTVTAVNTDNGTITVSPVPTGWAKDDQVDAWLPTASPIGVALESSATKVFVGGTAGKLMEGSITLGTPTSFVDELGNDYPGENADNTRAFSMDNSLYFRAEDVLEFKRGYDGYELPVHVVLGNKAGGSLSLVMRRVKFVMPSTDAYDPFVILKRSSAILGTKGNDSLVLVQE